MAKSGGRFQQRFENGLQIERRAADGRGVAATWPLMARAQQPAMPVIGFMSSRSPEDSAYLVETFRGGLKDGGFVRAWTASRPSNT
jgi:hypothetical protein